MALINTVPDQGHRGSLAKVLEVRNLAVRYRNGALGVEDVSFFVGASEVISILGPNGAGKTTTSRSIIGFLKFEGAKVANGSVILMGKSIANFEPHRVVKLGVGYVPERRKVFATLTVAENLQAVRRASTRADQTAALERVHTLFPILFDKRKEYAGQLSGGQQQMVAIGRSLLLNPRLLIIDEMTLGLHPSLHEELFLAMRQVAADGTAVVLFEEGADSALEHSDYVYVLRSGCNSYEGLPEIFIGNELLAAGYVDS